MVQSPIRWPIERKWTIRPNDGGQQPVVTTDLKGFQLCGLLGPAGAGKTYEIDLLADVERASGRDVRVERLAELAQTVDGLSSRLSLYSANATPNSVLYLDALDEVLVPVPMAATVIAAWTRKSLRPKGLSLRLSCRSAVWPGILQSAFDEFGDCAAVATLQPLDVQDIECVVRAYPQVDAEAFLSSLKTAGVGALAQHPLAARGTSRRR